MKSLELAIPGTDYAYSVFIGSSILNDRLSAILSNYTERNIFFLTNRTIHNLYPNLADNFLPPHVRCHTCILSDGGQHKHIGSVMQICDFLIENGANRNSILIAFGGGVVGDMGGFAAAILMRGIPCIQIPTTLLSQVDSGIGGKTAVNHPCGKNLIGAFKQPLATIIDIDLLQTLPHREFVAGYAELVKHGFIKDRQLFELLDNTSCRQLPEKKNILAEVIYRSCKVKAEVVEKDEREGGIRAILNFGHTIVHFLETLTEYRQYLHGEAIVAGMDFAVWWSMNQGQISKEEFERVHRHLAKLGITIRIAALNRESFVSIIRNDKKATATGIRFIGLKGIGDANIFENVSLSKLWEDFQKYIAGEFSLIAAGTQ